MKTNIKRGIAGIVLDEEGNIIVPSDDADLCKLWKGVESISLWIRELELTEDDEYKKAYLAVERIDYWLKKYGKNEGINHIGFNIINDLFKDAVEYAERNM